MAGRHDGTTQPMTGQSIFHSRLYYGRIIYTFIVRCIIQLGTTGTISGFDIDTANFNGVPTHLSLSIAINCVYSPTGNEAPQVSVYALYDANLTDPQHDDPKVRWKNFALQ